MMLTGSARARPADFPGREQQCQDHVRWFGQELTGESVRGWASVRAGRHVIRFVTARETQLIQSEA